MKNDAILVLIHLQSTRSFMMIKILLIRKDLPIKVTCVNVYEKIMLKGISFLLECFKRDVNKARVSLKFICLFFLIFTL